MTTIIILHGVMTDETTFTFLNRLMFRFEIGVAEIRKAGV
jgi:hypothetical protein